MMSTPRLIYSIGLRVIREIGTNLGIPLHVFGPETHMTAIVGMALGKRPIIEHAEGHCPSTTANFLLPGGQTDVVSDIILLNV